LVSLRRGAPRCTLFPYTTLFRSQAQAPVRSVGQQVVPYAHWNGSLAQPPATAAFFPHPFIAMTRSAAASAPRIEAGFIFNGPPRSEEHTSELQSLRHLVCRLLLE